MSIKPSSDIVITDFEESAVLLDMRTDTYFALNDSAARLWRALASGASLEVAVAEICNGYDASPDAVFQDVQVFVEELVGAGLARHET